MRRSSNRESGAIAQIRKQVASHYEALTGPQKLYVQILYMTLVVSLMLSASASIVRLYHALGMFPFSKF